MENFVTVGYFRQDNNGMFFYFEKSQIPKGIFKKLNFPNLLINSRV